MSVIEVGSKRLYSYEALREKLGVSEKTLRRYRGRGFLKPVIVGGKAYFSEEQVLKFLERGIRGG